jgi:Ankyrin repeats (many copies)
LQLHRGSDRHEETFYCLRAVLEQVSNIDIDDISGRTPLHEAAMLGFPGVVLELLRRGADPSKRDRRGRLPLNYAVGYNQTKAVRLLLSWMKSPLQWKLEYPLTQPPDQIYQWEDFGDLDDENFEIAKTFPDDPTMLKILVCYYIRRYPDSHSIAFATSTFERFLKVKKDVTFTFERHECYFCSKQLGSAMQYLQVSRLNYGAPEVACSACVDCRFTKPRNDQWVAVGGQVDEV